VNTRKASECTQPTKSRVTVKKQRKKETIPRASVLETEHAEGTNGEAQKNDNIPSQEEESGDLPEVKNPMQTETTPKRISMMKIGGQCKKMRVHKETPQLTITEDDAELVADKVQDRGEEALYVVESQREELMKNLMEVKEVLEILQINVAQQKGTVQQEKTHEEKETVQTTTMGSETFQINQGMLQIDKDTMHKTLKGYRAVGLGVVQDSNQGIIQATN
jgi:hypothetical protein